MPSLADNCAGCGEEYPYALPQCPMCRKAICENCAVRMGGNTYCGTPCAHAFFFGGQEDVEDESDLSRLEDGE